MTEARVPGIDPNTNDILKPGHWANHKDGSLVYVKDIDLSVDDVSFYLYEVVEERNAIMYSSSLRLKDFETIFTYDPTAIDKINLKWLWHTDTPIPWDILINHTDIVSEAIDTSSKPTAAYKTADFLNAEGVLLTKGMIVRITALNQPYESSPEEDKQIVDDISSSPERRVIEVPFSEDLSNRSEAPLVADSDYTVTASQFYSNEPKKKKGFMIGFVSVIALTLVALFLWYYPV